MGSLCSIDNKPRDITPMDSGGSLLWWPKNSFVIFKPWKDFLWAWFVLIISIFDAVDRTWTMVTEGILLCPINRQFISLFPGSVLFQVMQHFFAVTYDMCTKPAAPATFVEQELGLQINFAYLVVQAGVISTRCPWMIHVVLRQESIQKNIWKECHSLPPKKNNYIYKYKYLHLSVCVCVSQHGPI